MASQTRFSAAVLPLGLVVLLAAGILLDTLRTEMRQYVAQTASVSTFALFSVIAGLVMAGLTIGLVLAFARAPLPRRLAWAVAALGLLMLCFPLLWTSGMPVPAFVWYAWHPASAFSLQASAFWFVIGVGSLLRR